MSTVSKGRLLTIMPQAAARIDDWIEVLNETMEKYEINTPLRQAAWLANVALETGELKWIKELWGPTEQQKKYDTDPGLMAQLGNTEPGDGFRFRGRGLPQLTGRGLYTQYAAARDIDCVKHPELLELPQYAADVGGWFWRDVKRMNPIADAGEFRVVVKKWNGGYTHWDKRRGYYAAALAVLE